MPQTDFMKGLAALTFSISFVEMFVLMLVVSLNVMLEIYFDSISSKHGVLHHGIESLCYEKVLQM
jgi:hypothetical protein